MPSLPGMEEMSAPNPRAPLFKPGKRIHKANSLTAYDSLHILEDRQATREAVGLVDVDMLRAVLEINARSAHSAPYFLFTKRGKTFKINLLMNGYWYWV